MIRCRVTFRRLRACVPVCGERRWPAGPVRATAQTARAVRARTEAVLGSYWVASAASRRSGPSLRRSGPILRRGETPDAVRVPRMEATSIAGCSLAQWCSRAQWCSLAQGGSRAPRYVRTQRPSLCSSGPPPAVLSHTSGPPHPAVPADTLAARGDQAHPHPELPIQRAHRPGPCTSPGTPTPGTATSRRIGTTRRTGRWRITGPHHPQRGPTRPVPPLPWSGPPPAAGTTEARGLRPEGRLVRTLGDKLARSWAEILAEQRKWHSKRLTEQQGISGNSVPRAQGTSGNTTQKPHGPVEMGYAEPAARRGRRAEEQASNRERRAHGRADRRRAARRKPGRGTAGAYRKPSGGPAAAYRKPSTRAGAAHRRSSERASEQAGTSRRAGANGQAQASTHASQQEAGRQAQPGKRRPASKPASTNRQPQASNQAGTGQQAAKRQRAGTPQRASNMAYRKPSGADRSGVPRSGSVAWKSGGLGWRRRNDRWAGGGAGCSVARRSGHRRG